MFSIKRALGQIRDNVDSVFLLSTISVFSAIVLYFVVKTSNFVRLYGDDYCTTAMLHKLGYLQAQIYWYNTWSGRYAYNLLVHFSELFSLHSVKILPILLFTLTALSFAWALRQIFGKGLGTFVSLDVGLCLASLMVVNSPNIYQTLYWQTGSLTYLVPFIFLNIVAGMIIKIYRENKKINNYSLLLIFFLTFFAGGFNESYVALQLTMLAAFVLIVTLLWRKRQPIICGMTAIAGSLLSLVVMVIAPGNKVRQAQLPKPLPLTSVIAETIKGTVGYVGSVFRDHAYLFALILVFLIGFYFIIKLNKKIKTISLRCAILTSTLLLVTGFVSIGSVYAPGLYALSENPPDRTLFLVQYPLLICALSIGMVLGVYAKNINKPNYRELSKGIANIAGICMFAILVFLAHTAIGSGRSTFANVKQYSVQWDLQSAAISKQLTSNERNLKITWIPPIGDLPDPQRTDNGWVNVCMSDYFGVNSVTAIH